MNILVISNLYPPIYEGGYELACEQMVNFLLQRGNNVQVITSDYRKEADLQPLEYVHRVLTWDHKIHNKRYYQRICWLIKRELRARRVYHHWRFFPDIVFAWNCNGIPISFLQYFQRNDIPIICYVFDEWLCHWNDDVWISMKKSISAQPWKQGIKDVIIKRCGLITEKELSFNNLMCCSKFIKGVMAEKFHRPQSISLQPWGIDIEHFTFSPHRKGETTQLLFVGRFCYEKGVHELIEMVIILIKHYKKDITLSLYGFITDEEYYFSLKQQVNDAELSNKIKFFSYVDHEQIKDLYHSHDILIFPSLWAEPFGITILEAMASGIIVIASGTGGSKELIVDHESGFFYNKNTISEGIKVIKTVVEMGESDLCHIREDARKRVESLFDLKQVYSNIERELLKLVH